MKPPHAPRLLALDSLPWTPLGQVLPPALTLVAPAEELPLPFPFLRLFFPPQLPLRVFDFGFLGVGGVHVALGDGRDDFGPRFVGFPGVLLRELGDGERGDGVGAGVELIDDGAVFAATLAHGECFGPLSLDCVENFLLFACGVQRCGEAILLARNPPLAGVVYFCDVARGGGYIGAAIEFDEGLAIDEAFDVDVGEGD